VGGEGDGSTQPLGPRRRDGRVVAAAARALEGAQESIGLAVRRRPSSAEERTAREGQMLGRAG
jgi:hypothetical protein